MDEREQAELEQLQSENIVALSILQAQIHALIATSDCREKVIDAYCQRMERHLANSLGSPLPESFLKLQQDQHQKALEELKSMP